MKIKIEKLKDEIAKFAVSFDDGFSGDIYQAVEFWEIIKMLDYKNRITPKADLNPIMKIAQPSKGV